jgi:hypothetical protein
MRSRRVAAHPQRSQRLLGLQRAFEAAEDRPSRLGNALAGLGFGGGVMAGDPLTGALTAMLTKAQDAPRAGALAGIAPSDASQVLENPALQRLLLAMRTATASDEEVDAAVLRAMLEESGRAAAGPDERAFREWYARHA